LNRSHRAGLLPLCGPRSVHLPTIRPRGGQSRRPHANIPWAPQMIHRLPGGLFPRLAPPVPLPVPEISVCDPVFVPSSKTWWPSPRGYFPPLPPLVRCCSSLVPPKLLVPHLAVFIAESGDAPGPSGILRKAHQGPPFPSESALESGNPPSFPIPGRGNKGGDSCSGAPSPSVVFFCWFSSAHPRECPTSNLGPSPFEWGGPPPRPPCFVAPTFTLSPGPPTRCGSVFFDICPLVGGGPL